MKTESRPHLLVDEMGSLADGTDVLFHAVNDRCLTRRSMVFTLSRALTSKCCTPLTSATRSAIASSTAVRSCEWTGLGRRRHVKPSGL
jgi:hypothetical protein